MAPEFTPRSITPSSIGGGGAGRGATGGGSSPQGGGGSGCFPLIVVGILVFGVIAYFVNLGDDDNSPASQPASTHTGPRGPADGYQTAPPIFDPPPGGGSDSAATYPVPDPTREPAHISYPSGSTGQFCGKTSRTYRFSSAMRGVYLTVTPGATVPATHCNFAMNVARALDVSSDMDFPVYVVASSPNTGNTYRLECNTRSVDPIIIDCWDGNTAQVFLHS